MACYNGWPDIARLLIAVDGSAEHLRMQNKYRNKALDTGNYEIKVLLIAAVEAAAGAE